MDGPLNHPLHQPSHPGSHCQIRGTSREPWRGTRMDRPLGYSAAYGQNEKQGGPELSAPGRHMEQAKQVEQAPSADGSHEGKAHHG